MTEYSRDFTTTSDIIWFKVKDNEDLKFSYYDHDVSIKLKREEKVIHAQVLFKMIDPKYPPGCYTTLWIISEEEYKSEYNPTSVYYASSGQTVSHSCSREVNGESLLIGFYIYL